MRSLAASLVALAMAAPAAAQSIFFSQFQEASSGNNKYFQIFNPTSSTISLDDYSIAYCANGCSDDAFEYGWTFAAGATIAPCGTYLVCHSAMEGDTSVCDEALSDYIVYFNGDDMRAIITGTDYTTATTADIVDMVGLLGADPGSYWPVCGTSSGMDTRNGLLLRDTAVTSGDATGAAFESTWDASVDGACEWTEVAQYTTPYADWVGACATDPISSPAPSPTPEPCPATCYGFTCGA